MRNYELACIIHPGLAGDDLTAFIEKITALVERSGGQVVNVEPWGLRRLAYPIRKEWEGQYVFMRLEMEPKGVAGFERDLALQEPVMRHLVVAIE